MFSTNSSSITRIVLLVVFALLLTACTGGAATEEATAPPATATSEPAVTEEPEAGADEAMAQQLWEDLQATNYPDEWATVPGKGTLYRGQAPHGMLLSTYLNPDAEQALQGQPGQMPEGAIIVKENYTEDEALDSVTVMSKQAGFDPNHNDWFWAKYGVDGELQAAGQAAGCIACHGSVRSNDYVFTFPLALISPEGLPPDIE